LKPEIDDRERRATNKSLVDATFANGVTKDKAAVSASDLFRLVQRSN
jgi:hypothetical protein